MKMPDFTLLNDAGLNLQAVFNITDLPVELATDIRRRFDPECQYQQLILIGHGGKTLWTSLMASGITTENPIDDFSSEKLRQSLAGYRHTLIYPATDSVGLQALGKLAGWHHTTPFMVGINQTWGSWYAYRAVALSDTDFAPTPPLVSVSPCSTCQERPCITACPAKAVSGGAFNLTKCVAYRKQPTSLCRETCLARISCPVGSEHRYDNEQIRHTYSISMRMIEQYY